MNFFQEPSKLNSLKFNKETSLLSQSYPIQFTSQETSNNKIRENSIDKISYNINKNPNGLLNIIRSPDNIKEVSKKIKPLPTKKAEARPNAPELKTGICTACSKISNLFCTCNVSVQAITKLYSNSNRSSFINYFNDSLSQQQQLPFNENPINRTSDPKRFDHKNIQKSESYLSYENGKLNDLNGIDFEKIFEIL